MFGHKLRSMLGMTFILSIIFTTILDKQSRKSFNEIPTVTVGDLWRLAYNWLNVRIGLVTVSRSVTDRHMQTESKVSTRFRDPKAQAVASCKSSMRNRKTLSVCVCVGVATFQIRGPSHIKNLSVG